MPHVSHEFSHQPLTRTEIGVAVAIGGIIVGAFVAVGQRPGAVSTKYGRSPLPSSARGLVYAAVPSVTPNLIQLNCPADNPSSVRPESIALHAGQTDYVRVTTLNNGQPAASSNFKIEVLSDQMEPETLSTGPTTTETVTGTQLGVAVTQLSRQSSVPTEQSWPLSVDKHFPQTGANPEHDAISYYPTVKHYDGTEFATYSYGIGYVLAVACTQ